MHFIFHKWKKFIPPKEYRRAVFTCWSVTNHLQPEGTSKPIKVVNLLHSNSFTDLTVSFKQRLLQLFLRKWRGWRRTIDMCCMVGYYLEKFSWHQENNYTLSKSQRDLWLLKDFLVSRNKLGQKENIDATDFNMLTCIWFKYHWVTLSNLCYFGFNENSHVTSDKRY